MPLLSSSSRVFHKTIPCTYVVYKSILDHKQKYTPQTHLNDSESNLPSLKLTLRHPVDFSNGFVPLKAVGPFDEISDLM